MKPHTEIELKFQVPAASRAALAAEVSRRTKSLEHVSLAAAYLDTEDRRLARAGLAWRLRREGRRWIQTLKTGGATALERFEHDAIRPDATHDAQAHAGTVAGERLLAILREARHEGLEPVARYRTEVRRTVRRIRTRGAVVELAWDEGRLVAGGATQRIRELEFELVSGSPQAMLALADRWRRRFGLILDPRSKAERGDRLADGHPHPAVRKARRPDVLRRADARQAYVAVLDECLAQILRNTIGLIDGDPALRVEHVHQLRVGIRRLRSALRSFEGWVPDPPPALVEGLKVWFVALGACRDADVMSDGVAAELARAGAPPLPAPSGARGSDPAALCRADAIQRTWTPLRPRATRHRLPIRRRTRPTAYPIRMRPSLHRRLEPPWRQPCPASAYRFRRRADPKAQPRRIRCPMKRLRGQRPTPRGRTDSIRRSLGHRHHRPTLAPRRRRSPHSPTVPPDAFSAGTAGSQTPGSISTSSTNPACTTCANASSASATRWSSTHRCCARARPTST